MRTSHLRNLLFVPAVIIIMSGCSNHNATPSGPVLPEKAPYVSAVKPDVALPGDEVTITGVNFGEWAEYANVSFGTEKADIVSITDTKLVVQVPAPSPSLISPKVRIEITVGEFITRKAYFSYSVPVLSKCSKATGFPGEELILSGSGFAEPEGGCTVVFDETEVQIVEASDDRLVVIAPESDQATVKIKALNPDYPVLCSSEITYQYDAAATELAKAEWLVNTDADGAVCRKVTVKIKLLETEKTLDISVFEAPLRGKYDLAIGMSHVQNVAPTSAICANYGALAGINASFFNMDTDGRCCDYVRIDGRQTIVGRGMAVQNEALNSAMVFNYRGEEVYFKSFYSRDGPAYNVNDLAAQLEGENVLVAGPSLMLEGKVMDIPASVHNNLNTSRSAVGITPSNRFIMVAVDYKNGMGVTNHEHAELMRLLGCYEAMSLDGGGSTTLYYRDWGGSGVVNSPSGGSERAVCNVIYIKAR